MLSTWGLFLSSDPELCVRVYYFVDIEVPKNGFKMTTFLHRFVMSSSHFTMYYVCIIISFIFEVKQAERFVQ